MVMKTIPKFLAVLVFGLLMVAGVRLTMSPATAASTSPSDGSLRVKAVWIYPFEAQESGCFRDATIIQKDGTCIRFKAGDRVYDHCGHYTIEN